MTDPVMSAEDSGRADALALARVLSNLRGGHVSTEAAGKLASALIEASAEVERLRAEGARLRDVLLEIEEMSGQASIRSMAGRAINASLSSAARPAPKGGGA